MQLKHILAASAAILTVGLAAPSLAQDTGLSEAGPGSADNNDVDIEDNGNNRDNDANDNGNNRDNDDNEANDNGNNRDNEANDNGNNRDNEANDNGNNRDNDDNEANDNGNNRDNDDNGDNRDNEVEANGAGSASRGGEIEDNGDNRENGNSTIVATQTLIATNTNQNMDELVDMDGDDGTVEPVGYNSGNNSVAGSAFAAFAGILNNAWNTGINANSQAATNIAAQGTVNFGDGGGAAAPGGGGGDD